MKVAQRKRIFATSHSHCAGVETRGSSLPLVLGEGVGATHRYLEDPLGDSLVLGWLRTVAVDLLEVPVPPHGVSLYFREFGPLVPADDGTLDSHRSPMVSVFLPRIRRGTVWTVGEVHFVATPLRKLYPGLHKISRQLGKWMAQFECVFADGRCPRPEWDYQLEGSAKSYDSPIYALPGGLEALNSGRYFVSRNDTAFTLDKLCRQLRLRGIQCGEEDADK